MSSQWPDDDRLVPLPEDESAADAPIPEDPELLEDEVQAEQPLALGEDDLRGDGPPEEA
jgi:hypothetical protein